MIRLDSVRVIFNKHSPLEMKALDGVDIDVPDGQFLTVIGSNGAGKSTFLNAIAGETPIESGRVFVGGQDITRWSTHKRAAAIARVFQDPIAGTCEQMSILENMALARMRTNPRGFGFAIDRSLRELARERLALLGLGLENRLEDRVGLLSGGQRQALSLIMTTTGATSVLLLDEHTAALDPATAEFVMALTDRVVRELGTTTIMVTHSMRQALDYGDRTVMFHRGRIVFDVMGGERSALDVQDLLQLFRRREGAELADDSLLLE